MFRNVLTKYIIFCKIKILYLNTNIKTGGIIMIGAKAIIRCLEEEGVTTVFGYPGGAVLPLYEELRKSDIKHVLIRNEQNAVHFASGYARGSKGVGVCFATSGPGATNLITGIATAYMDSIPVVIITGQVSSDLIGSDAFQEADIVGATQPFTKHNYLVKSASEIPRIMKEAFYIASTGRPGPVLIDVPVDVQKEALRFSYPKEVSITGYKPTYEGHRGQIKRAVQAIKKSVKPLLYAGGGVIAADAVEELRSFAFSSRIPVVNSLMGIGSFPHDNELYVGIVGSHGHSYSNRIMSSADLVIIVGVRLSDRATKKLEQMNPDLEVVHIDIDPAEIGKNIASTIPVVGHAKNILADFNESGIALDTAKWLEEIKSMKAEYPVQFNMDDSMGLVSPKHALGTLSRILSDSAAVTADVGQNQIWAARNYQIKGTRGYYTSGGLGTMGYSLPAAAGMKMADEGRQVVAIMGDGSIQMCLGELGTVSEHNVGIKIVLFNNNRLGMVRELQDNAYGKGKYSAVEFKITTDFVKIAQAYGIEGTRVKTNSEFDAAVEKALAHEGPYIIECIVHPDYATI